MGAYLLVPPTLSPAPAQPAPSNHPPNSSELVLQPLIVLFDCTCHLQPDVLALSQAATRKVQVPRAAAHTGPTRGLQAVCLETALQGMEECLKASLSLLLLKPALCRAGDYCRLLCSCCHSFRRLQLMSLCSINSVPVPIQWTNLAKDEASRASGAWQQSESKRAIQGAEEAGGLVVPWPPCLWPCLPTCREETVWEPLGGRLLHGGP